MRSETLEGWGNSIQDKFNLLNDPDLKAKSEKRLLICNTCPLRDNNTCSRKRQGECVEDFLYKDQPRFKGEFYNGCGCNLSSKSLVNEILCPLNKWKDI